jgi:type I site-specific restriction endonuclease
MDCYHIIINGLILLIFLHILLSNIDFHQVIGRPKEQVVEKFGRQLGVPDNQTEERKKMDYQKSIQFLQDNDSQSESGDDNFKQKLLSFIKKTDEPKKLESPQVAQKEFMQKNIPPVMASNTFTSNLNVPNFESNVLNVQKFYTINSPDSSMENFDNMDVKELRQNIQNMSNDSFTNEQTRSGMILKKTPIPNHSNDVNDSKSSFGRIATELPPTWEYKNELPMNGGPIGGGIIGFDALESQFSMYSPGSMQMQQANSPNFQVIPHDDLRKPIIYEN